MIKPLSSLAPIDLFGPFSKELSLFYTWKSFVPHAIWGRILRKRDSCAECLQDKKSPRTVSVEHSISWLHRLLAIPMWLLMVTIPDALPFFISNFVYPWWLAVSIQRFFFIGWWKFLERRKALHKMSLHWFSHMNSVCFQVWNISFLCPNPDGVTVNKKWFTSKRRFNKKTLDGATSNRCRIETVNVAWHRRIGWKNSDFCF